MTKNVLGFRKSRGGRTAGDPSSIRTTVTQGLGALAISALGLAVAGTITLNSTVNTVNASQTAVASETGQPNTNHAEPAAGSEGTSSADVEAAADAAENAESSESAEAGDLEQFSRDREGRASRSTIRVALDSAVESEVAADRSEKLDEVAESAGSESRKAVASARSDSLEAEVEAARREEARAQEAKKKAEEAKKAEDSGTLQNSSTADTPPPPSSDAPSGEVSGSGGASPIAKGSYRVGARWGAVGSWSRYHTGQDLPAPVGTPIRAAVDGTVMPASGGGWAGTHVIIKASDGSSTLYAHMSSTSVSPGQTVKAGQNIGAVGMTGRTFGPHLHFEYYKAGVSPGDVYSSSDPYAWMLSKGVQL